MSLFEKIRVMAARHALERKTYTELSGLSDRELQDLDLNRARLADLARDYAWSKRV